MHGPDSCSACRYCTSRHAEGPRASMQPAHPAYAACVAKPETCTGHLKQPQTLSHPQDARAERALGGPPGIRIFAAGRVGAVLPGSTGQERGGVGHEGKAVHDGRHVDHPGSAALELGLQEPCEQVGPQVVDLCTSLSPDGPQRASICVIDVGGLLGRGTRSRLPAWWSSAAPAVSRDGGPGRNVSSCMLGCG